MKVQITNNTSQSAVQPAAPAKQTYQLATGSRDSIAKEVQVRTGKDLQKAEDQGTKISVGQEQLVRAIDRAIKALEGPSTSFEMKVHDQTNTIMVKVINKDTGEVIREIPPEKTLDLVAKMMEFAGILIDEKV
ncbi:flagellar protein FlaG [Cohnella luojiensis]|uniref:Flagellar protein FlaG n=1 Tax=Cohnella luojiensis TaxID=652876 RepID=A0A4Y8M401_9BACL|nr:flagellar protein FlaG [Cohnella luojiensis]TFE29032.1 flagellar protein FlaG [Cohnella luojiensis]